MIQTILNIIKPSITAMTWVERYAGLAIPMTRTVLISESEGYKNEKKETFPISSDVDMTRCWENSLYKDLVPNSTYKSVIYWEDLSGLQEYGVRRLSGGRTIYLYQADLRMVCWLNMRLLGYYAVSGTSQMQQDAVRVINRIGGDNVVVSGVKIKYYGMRMTSILKRDHNLIFGQYAYGSKGEYFMYPYDFFAINVRLNLELTSDCVAQLAANSPIVC